MELLQSLQEAMCTLNTPCGLDFYKHSHHPRDYTVSLMQTP